MPGIELHCLLVVARQVHEVNSKFEFGFLKFVSATSDIILVFPEPLDPVNKYRTRRQFD